MELNFCFFFKMFFLSDVFEFTHHKVGLKLDQYVRETLPGCSVFIFKFFKQIVFQIWKYGVLPWMNLDPLLCSVFIQTLSLDDEHFKNDLANWELGFDVFVGFYCTFFGLFRVWYDFSLFTELETNMFESKILCVLSNIVCSNFVKWWLFVWTRAFMF